MAKNLQAPVKLVLFYTFKGKPLSLHCVYQDQHEHYNLTPYDGIVCVCRPCADENFQLGSQIINYSTNKNSES